VRTPSCLFVGVDLRWLVLWADCEPRREAPLCFEGEQQPAGGFMLRATFKSQGLVLLATLLLVGTWSVMASADDFDFSDTGDDDGGFDFTEPVKTRPEEPAFVMPSGDKPIIMAFFDPVDSTDPKTLERLNEALVGHLTEFEDYDTVIAVPIMKALAQMDFERDACVYDAACISGLARDLGVAKVVIGRIQTEGLGRPKISLEAFDVETAALENYLEFETAARLRSQEKELRPAAYKLFNRQIVGGDESLLSRRRMQVDRSLPTWQLVTSISSGVAGLALIGVGIKFGLDAKDYEDQVISGKKKGSISQVKAQSLLNDAKDASVLANVMYGVGGVAAAVAILMLVIRPGDELAEDQYQRSGYDLYLQPTFGAEGAGFVGGVRF